MIFIYCICLYLIYTQSVVSITTANRINGERFHSKAMELVNNGQYELALAYFRSACRHMNNSALYWNDLGVTEMRMGNLKSSRKRFKKALSIDPDFEVAKENFNEINTYQQTNNNDDDNSMYIEITDENQKIEYEHTVLQPGILSKEEFQELNHYFLRKERNHPNINKRIEKILSQPFIIQNALDLFNLTNNKLKKIFNRQYLTTHYGTKIVDFYPQNMKNLQSYPYFLSLAPALQQLLDKPEEIYLDSDISEDGTCIQWNMDDHIWNELLRTRLAATIPGIFDDYYYLQDCLQTSSSSNVDTSATTSSNSDISSTSTTIDYNGNILTNNKERINLNTTLLNQFLYITHWRMLLLGEHSCGMFFHSDTLHTASWQLQIVGSKKWHLCTNHQSILQSHDYTGKINLFLLNYKVYIKLKELVCYEAIVRTGDLLYYPSNYYHQTMNLETPSVALSGSIISQYNYKEVQEELRKECRGEGKIFAASEYREVCEHLDTCYLHWEQLWS